MEKGAFEPSKGKVLHIKAKPLFSASESVGFMLVV